MIPEQQPRRKIEGMSAVLLPFDEEGDIDWAAFEEGVARTHTAGLTPAVNMDTGYGPSLDSETRCAVEDATASLVGRGGFVVGANVDDNGPSVDVGAWQRALVELGDRGGLPVLFPSRAWAELPEGEIAPTLTELGKAADRFLGFELGPQFHPHGRIWSLETYAEVLEVPQVIGAKHSSLQRGPEFERLALRDVKRPEFMVLTGNDLAIDMVRWGSDYLLGLATFAPEEFALRDKLWAEGDPAVFMLDDALQALGAVAFRPPVPAYRHDAALAWELRGWAKSARVHPSCPLRPDIAAERELLSTLLDRLDAVVAELT